MASFQKTAGEAFDSLVEQRRSFLNQSKTASLSEGRTGLTSKESIQPIDTSGESLQDSLRPFFGKQGHKRPSIGGHPDYNDLKDTNQVQKGAITTLFVDMEGSTKLGLLHDLKDAFLFKDAIIRSTIDIVKAFDGHVHRLMGDAVMAYFGSKERSTEDGVVDGLNCAATLMAFYKEVVRPRLEDIGFSDAGGIRVGLDYGSRSKVLWGSYGVQNMSEVTATSFHVDVAAKLQQNAGRNQIFIGQPLKEHLDFPTDLLKTPTRIRSGEKEADYYVRPNLTGPDGQSVNYRKYRLRWSRYLSWSPLQLLSKEYGQGPKPVHVKALLHDSVRGTYRNEQYAASSRSLEKDLGIKFSFDPPEDISPPYTIITKVQNHGQEAQEDNACDRDPQSHSISDWRDQRNFGHWESTLYRGLHYLDFEIQKGNTIHYSTRYGVYVR